MRGIFQHELGQEHARLVAAKGGLAAKALVHHAPKREDVGPPIDHAPAIDGFRREVAGRAYQVPGAREPPVGVHQARDTEVEHLELSDLALDEKQVLRLDIAMDDVVGVGVGQGLGGLLEHKHCVGKRRRGVDLGHGVRGSGVRLVAREPLGEIFTLQPLHHQVAVMPNHAVGQVAHDGRVLERGQDLRLLHEALAVAVLVTAQQLHANLHVRHHVARTMHLPHAAGRNHFLQSKTVGEQPGSILSAAVASTGTHQFDYAPDPEFSYLPTLAYP